MHIPQPYPLFSSSRQLRTPSCKMASIHQDNSETLIGHKVSSAIVSLNFHFVVATGSLHFLKEYTMKSDLEKWSMLSWVLYWKFASFKFPTFFLQWPCLILSLDFHTEGKFAWWFFSFFPLQIKAIEKVRKVKYAKT